MENAPPANQPDPLPNPELYQVEAELCRRSLREFVGQAWHLVDQSNFVPNWHLDAVCEHLEAVSAGQIRNLLINMPPRHAKSLCVSVFWMVWSWISQPQTRWLYASYAAELSVRDSRRCRMVILSPWFQQRWGDRFHLLDDQNMKHRFENNQTGCRLATSVEGAATGEGGDIVCTDDPHNVRDSRNANAIKETLRWWDEVMSTRVNDPKTSARVIVMQRVAENDLSGHVIAQGGFEHLCLPAEFDTQRRCATSIGWKDPRTDDGELLFAARVGPLEIANFKLRIGPSGYAAQFQQRPAPAGGGRFKAEWFHYYTIEDDDYVLHLGGGIVKRVPVCSCDRFGMMDPASTPARADSGDGYQPCYTVIGIWDVTPQGEMIKIDHFRGQLEAPDVHDKALKLIKQWHPQWLGVERNGIGQGIVQSIKRTGVTVKPIVAKGSKESRSEIAEIRMAGGMIFFPVAAAWLADLLTELTLWPNSAHSDQVDELSHAAIYVQNRFGGLGGHEEKKDASPLPELADENEIGWEQLPV